MASLSNHPLQAMLVTRQTIVRRRADHFKVPPPPCSPKSRVIFSTRNRSNDSHDSAWLAQKLAGCVVRIQYGQQRTKKGSEKRQNRPTCITHPADAG
jgi:hypothetical protein